MLRILALDLFSRCHLIPQRDSNLQASWLRGDSSFSLKKSGFDPLAVHVKVLLKRMTDRFPFLRVLWFLHISFPAPFFCLLFIDLSSKGWALGQIEAGVLRDRSYLLRNNKEDKILGHKQNGNQSLLYITLWQSLGVFIMKACLKSHYSGYLCCSGMLRSEDWYFETSCLSHIQEPRTLE